MVRVQWKLDYWYWWRIILIDIKIEDFELNWIDLITFRSRWRTWFECRYSTARSNWTNHLQSLYWYHHIQQPPIRSALVIMTQMSSTSDREDGLKKLEKWSHFKIFYDTCIIQFSCSLSILIRRINGSIGCKWFIFELFRDFGKRCTSSMED